MHSIDVMVMTLMQVFCEEQASELGHFRHFVAASYSRLWQRYSALPPHERHIYEVKGASLDRNFSKLNQIKSKMKTHLLCCVMCPCDVMSCSVFSPSEKRLRLRYHAESAHNMSAFCCDLNQCLIRLVAGGGAGASLP